MGKKMSDDAVSDSGESSDSVSSSADSSPEKSDVERTSDTDSSSGSESESDSSSMTDTEDEKVDSSEKKSSNLSFRPPAAFKPPSGFKPVKAQSPPSSSVTSLLSNLQGKQVFHITAPAFLPLSAVREVSLAKVMRGEPVLNHKGVDYGIPTEPHQEHGAQTLMLYNKETGSYQSVPVRNIQSYHVQELVRLPGGIDGSLVPPTAAQESSKPPRPQPKGMKMRFRPVGSGDGPPETIGTSSESEGEEPSFKMPQRLKTEQEERKRKQLPTDDKADGSSRKKSKKHSFSQDAEGLQSSQNEPVPSSQATSQDAQEDRGRKDSSHKHKKSHKHRDETSQERKARKEEKKKKKAEKAA
ncbi:hypothetical protein VTN77DRAFT_3111 [Rasamsonia byssochlamydoides]|uniref:uncharacterized protein n=1 Tax=Rasamsonia byssochlamydoides TaxID=89139 RepID=UPI003743796F